MAGQTKGKAGSGKGATAKTKRTAAEPHVGGVLMLYSVGIPAHLEIYSQVRTAAPTIILLSWPLFVC